MIFSRNSHIFVSRLVRLPCPPLPAEFRILSILRGKSDQIVKMDGPYRDTFCLPFPLLLVLC